MNRYENGKIYKIVDSNFQKMYVGSTCESLSQRMARHRNKYQQYKNCKYGRVTSFELFEEFSEENCKIYLIENYPCNNKEELLRREGHHIRNNDCVNKITVGRTKKEYHEEHKEENKQRCKEWMANNQEKRKQYVDKRKDIIDQYNREWKQNNKEHVKEYNRTYREEHKDKLTEKAICNVCGASIRKYDIKNHQLTKRCQSFNQQVEPHAEDMV